jgi:hypothetical protein
MNTRLLAGFLALAIIPAAQSAPAPKSSAEDETPYKSAKVGDSATYKMTMKVAGTSLDGLITQTVTAKSDKEMAVKTSNKLIANGREIPTPDKESTIDLTKPFDPLKSSVFGDNGGGAPPPPAEKVKEGKEKLTVAGKEYQATWTTYKVKLNAGAGQPMEAEMKVWTSPKFALYTLKAEMTADVAGMKMEMTMELTEAGTKEK